MRFETLTIGDELLDGRVADAHTREVGEALRRLGQRLSASASVADHLEEIVTAVRRIATRADVCVTTGGLGPTCDDLTFEALAKAAGVDLVYHPEVWAKMEARWGRTPSESNRRQAMLPEGCEVYLSEVGSAPAIRLRLDECDFYALPGVPSEMRWHLEEHVMPRLRPHTRRVHQQTLYFTGVGESALAEEMGAFASGVEVAWRVRPYDIAVTLKADTPERLDGAVAQARAAAPEACCGDVGLVEALLQQAAAHKLTLGAAESCTGGGLAAAITAVPGASAAFYGSIVSYANSVKMGALGVRAETLEAHGAVSVACAEEMADGARRALGVDYAVSVTGVAGPGGGTPDKPVGTVCFGLAGPEGVTAERLQLRGHARAEIQRRAIARALYTLWKGVETGGRSA